MQKAALAPPALAEECTAAVITPAAGEGNRPMLWKNRDTDTLSNKVVHVEETPYSYVALVDADDASGRRAWAGINTAGFGIMNTVAYNLPKASSEEMEDLEGVIMADALRTCRTVDEFEAYLKANQGRSLGARTNFGAIDAEGHAVVFETHNRGVQKVDAAEAPEKFLVVSNFSRTGKKGTGAGYLRFERATALFQTVPRPISPAAILRTLARDTGHVLLTNPTLADLHALPPEPRWVTTRHSIDRTDTSATVILVGKDPKTPASRPMMWVLPGEPVTAVAVPVWPDAGSTPAALREGVDAPLWAESLRIKRIGRPFTETEKLEYLDLARLDNREGTGFLPGLLEAEAQVQQRTAAFLARPHTPAELAAFQEEMAQLALGALRAVNAK